jgi:hypothetical protein
VPAREANDIIRDLLASGLRPEQTALVMELVLTMSTGLAGARPVESPVDRAAERRREWDRQRKRSQREAASGGKSGGKTRASSGGNPVESPPDGKSVSVILTEQSLLSSEEVKEEKKVRTRSKGSRISQGARLSEEDRTFAVRSGIPPDRVEALWSEFVDYWIAVPGTKGVKLDWPATWRNRVRDVLARFGKNYGNATSSHRADTNAGRATARETEFLASLGKGAAGYLEKGNAAGSVGTLPAGSGSADVVDIERARKAVN